MKNGGNVVWCCVTLRAGKNVLQGWSFGVTSSLAELCLGIRVEVLETKLFSLPSQLLCWELAAKPRSVVCWKGSHSLVAWICMDELIGLIPSLASDPGNTWAWAGCCYSVKQTLEHLEFCSDRVVREYGKRRVMEGAPVVSTARWARNITGFALTLLICVLGLMLNSPLKEKLESNRALNFSVLSFSPYWQKTLMDSNWTVVAYLDSSFLLGQ